MFVNTWSGVYYNNDTPPEGGFIVALKDTKGAGKADHVERFGQTFAEGGHGGTGVYIYKDGLYAEINDKIVRYALKDGEITPTGKPEAIFSGMPITGDHPMHPFIIDKDGNLFVSMGSATNTCEVRNRMPGSKGNEPCTELETRAGVWRYDANKRTGVLAEGAYALRHPQWRRLRPRQGRKTVVTQHGRDQLHENWSKLYTAEQASTFPPR